MLAKEIATHLNLIVSVVVEVENSIDLGFRGNSDILRICDSFSQSLAGIFLHLDVVEFPVKIKEYIMLLEMFKDPCAGYNRKTK